MAWRGHASVLHRDRLPQIQQLSLNPRCLFATQVVRHPAPLRPGAHEPLARQEDEDEQDEQEADAPSACAAHRGSSSSNGGAHAPSVQ